jgi:hypothetical protein
MAAERKPLVSTLKEHDDDRERAATFDGREGRAPQIRRRLDDLGELRRRVGVTESCVTRAWFMVPFDELRRCV